jgi:pyruvate dehydrogenase E1 component alpha subunit
MKAEALLRQLNYGDESYFAEIGDRVKKEIEAGTEFAEASPLPEGKEVLEGVFATEEELRP